MRLACTLWIAGLLVAARGAPAAAQDQVEGLPYVALETRAATRARMEELLMPARGTWGDWFLLAPFPYAGHGRGDLATPHAPEGELARMAAGGPGPDLTAVYAGKNGVEARWEALGAVVNERLDLHRSSDPALADLVCAYLYTTVVAPEDQTLDVTLGSDDGARLWLNGALLLDRDVPRGLDPRDDALRLRLRAGVNHVLVKVCEGYGAWEFQLLARRELTPREDAALQFLLDRDFPPGPERAYWEVSSYPVPEDVVLEVGGLAVGADGRPRVATRRGDVYVVDEAYGSPPLDARFTPFARGLHEPLGCAVRNEDGREVVYCVQRGELTRLVDLDGDGRADRYDAVCDGWGVSGNYHEFAFGPKFDRDGNAWVTLNVGFCGSLGKSIVPWRGWALKITPSGELVPVCDGLRSPNGLGAWIDGEMFYVDNQGDWVATNRLSHLAPGAWHGHPASLRWRDDLPEGARPPLHEASVWFPYRKMGQSAADVVLDDTGGAFGPFSGQLLVGDQTLATVMRVWLERVDGHYQGACFPFLGGLDCGVNRLCFLPDGSLLIGETARGWGSVGRKPYGLQRAVWRGVVPFALRTMRALSDGFELEFTLDLASSTAEDPASYRMSSYTYEHHAEYGAPEADVRALEVRSATMTGPRTVRLEVAPLRAGYVHELHADGVRSVREDAQGQLVGLLHPEAYYTLARVPR